MSKSAVNFFLKLVILIFLILPSYANNYSYEEFKSETFNKELSMYDYCKSKFSVISKTENTYKKRTKCVYDLLFESKILGTTTTKNLACNYLIEDDRKTCVCRNKNKDSFSRKFYQLDKVLNETQCKKAQKYVKDKRQKIKEKCIKKAGKMKTDSAYKDMLYSCLRKKISNNVIN